MAGAELNVDMGDDDLLPAWRTVIDVADTGIAEGLTLVGGLMVAVHARRAGVEMLRTTSDMDALVGYWTNRCALIDARTALRGIGFELTDTDVHAYRFEHSDGRQVDIMVADHLPSRMRPRLGSRSAFQAPAGRQAINRRDTYTLTFTGGSTAPLGVPDELGALVAKGAAFTVDARDRRRHLDDAAVLLACVADASALDYAGTSSNDRRRIRATLTQLRDDAHPSRIGLDDAARARGHMNALLIARAVA